MRRAITLASFAFTTSFALAAAAQDDAAAEPRKDAATEPAAADAGAEQPAENAAEPTAKTSDDKPVDRTKKDGDDDREDGEDKDNVRFRGGFIVPAVGPAFIPSADISGLVIAPIGFDLGVQINHYIGIIYQATPLVTLLSNGDDTVGGFVLDNSFLAVFSIGKGVYFDAAAGPSIDLYALGSIGASGIGADAAVAPGIATKVALGFGGGPSDDSARRAAFKISVDPHFTFLPGAAMITIPVGIGVEWF